MESLTGASSSSSSSMEFVFYDGFEFEFVEGVECFSNWELLDVSDADSEMFGNRDEGEGEGSGIDAELPGDLRDRLSPLVSVPVPLAEEDRLEDRVADVYLLQNQEGDFVFDYDGNRYDCNRAEEEDEVDDDGDDYDLDDELVPWSVSGKLGRQRMRKLGKRAFTKMNNSKRSPLLFITPGCVRGKHGLGLKHSY